MDDLAMAMAIGLPIVLVSMAGVLVALTGEPPASRSREAGREPAAIDPDDELGPTAGRGNG
jgi:hypothetical protein